MRIISRRVLDEFGRMHPGARTPLSDWYRFTKSARWASLNDVRLSIPYVDHVRVKDTLVSVFNVGGNNYRLITVINFATGIIYVGEVLTHAESDTQKWKTRI